MSSRNRVPLEKEQFWRFAIEEHACSGLSVRAFCEQESLSVPSFYGWRRRLQGRSAKHQSPSDLVPVHVVGVPPANMLEIVMPSSVTVRVPVDCCQESLSAVLSAVRETFPC